MTWIQDLKDPNLHTWQIETKSYEEAERWSKLRSAADHCSVTIETSDNGYYKLVSRDFRRELLHPDYVKTGNYKRKELGATWNVNTRVLVCIGREKHQQLHGCIVQIHGSLLTIQLDDGAHVAQDSTITYDAVCSALFLYQADERIYIDIASTKHYQMLHVLCEINKTLGWRMGIMTYYEDSDDEGKPPKVEYSISFGQAKDHVGVVGTERAAIEEMYNFGCATGALFDPEKETEKRIQSMRATIGAEEGQRYLSSATFICRYCGHHEMLVFSSRDSWHTILSMFNQTEKTSCPNCGH